MVSAASSEVRPFGVEHIDLTKAGRHGAVRHRRDLLRLALAAVKAAAEVVGRRVAEPVHRIPEIRGAALVGDVAQHAAELAVLDLVEHLPAELEIVTLLIDAEAGVADDVDPVFDAG